jgi:hypothetical protein
MKWKELLEIVGIVLVLTLMVAGAAAVSISSHEGNDGDDLWEHLMMDGE